MASSTLVLLPGFLCDEQVWRAQILALSGVANCVCVDWGLLDSIEAMAQHVLRTAPERFALAGHSMGGRVALEVYRMAPDRITHLALFNTGDDARPAGAAGEIEELKRRSFLNIARAEGMITGGRTWLLPMLHPSRRNDAAFVEPIVKMIARKTVDVWDAQMNALLMRPDLTAVPATIKCPALVSTGIEDDVTPAAQHERMAGAIVGCSLVLLPECGHMSIVERPAEVADAMRRWLVC